jgi:hypothetical protein
MFTEINGLVFRKKIIKNDSTIEMNGLKIDQGNTDLISFAIVNSKKKYPFWIEVYKTN